VAVNVNGLPKEKLMSQRHLRRRKLTEDERNRIVDQLPGVFEEHGVANHERSVFTRLVGEEVIGSSTPLFFCMQPKLKVRPSKAWARAYSLVFAWLEQNAKETREAISMEFTKSPKAPEKPAADAEFGNVSDEFDGLRRVGIDDFRDRVKGYSASIIPGRHSNHPFEDFNASRDESMPSGGDGPAVDEFNAGENGLEADSQPDPLKGSAEGLEEFHPSFSFV
jgi:hypothetical protein